MRIGRQRKNWVASSCCSCNNSCSFMCQNLIHIHDFVDNTPATRKKIFSRATDNILYIIKIRKKISSSSSVTLSVTVLFVCLFLHINIVVYHTQCFLKNTYNFETKLLTNKWWWGVKKKSFLSGDGLDAAEKTEMAQKSSNKISETALLPPTTKTWSCCLDTLNFLRTMVFVSIQNKQLNI